MKQHKMAIKVVLGFLAFVCILLLLVNSMDIRTKGDELTNESNNPSTVTYLDIEPAKIVTTPPLPSVRPDCYQNNDFKNYFDVGFKHIVQPNQTVYSFGYPVVVGVEEVIPNSSCAGDKYVNISINWIKVGPTKELNCNTAKVLCCNIINDMTFTITNTGYPPLNYQNFDNFYSSMVLYNLVVWKGNELIYADIANDFAGSGMMSFKKGAAHEGNVRFSVPEKGKYNAHFEAIVVAKGNVHAVVSTKDIEFGVDSCEK
jgi:hypothetical protein